MANTGNLGGDLRGVMPSPDVIALTDEPGIRRPIKDLSQEKFLKVENGVIVTRDATGPDTVVDHRITTNRDALAQHPATSVTADTTNFNNNLSSADNTVQKALDTIDDLELDPDYYNGPMYPVGVDDSGINRPGGEKVARGPHSHPVIPAEVTGKRLYPVLFTSLAWPDAACVFGGYIRPWNSGWSQIAPGVWERDVAGALTDPSIVSAFFDGVTPTLLMSVLHYYSDDPVSTDQYNGIYIITDLGSESTHARIERAGTANASSEFIQGKLVHVTGGNTYTDHIFRYNGINNPTLETSPLSFVDEGVVTPPEEDERALLTESQLISERAPSALQELEIAAGATFEPGGFEAVTFISRPLGVLEIPSGVVGARMKYRVSSGTVQMEFKFRLRHADDSFDTPFISIRSGDLTSTVDTIYEWQGNLASSIACLVDDRIEAVPVAHSTVAPPVTITWTFQNPLRESYFIFPIQFSPGGTLDHRVLTNRDALAQHPATSVTADTTNFNNNLSLADDTVQKALDTIDNLNLNPNPFPGYYNGPMYPDGADDSGATRPGGSLLARGPHSHPKVPPEIEGSYLYPAFIPGSSWSAARTVFGGYIIPWNNGWTESALGSGVWNRDIDGAINETSYANAFFDGEMPFLGMRVLGFYGSTGVHRKFEGLYQVTSLGSVSTKAQISRVADLDETADFIIGKVVQVTNGNSSAGHLFRYVGPSNPTLDVTELLFEDLGVATPPEGDSTKLLTAAQVATEEASSLSVATGQTTASGDAAFPVAFPTLEGFPAVSSLPVGEYRFQVANLYRPVDGTDTTTLKMRLRRSWGSGGEDVLVAESMPIHNTTQQTVTFSASLSSPHAMDLTDQLVVIPTLHTDSSTPVTVIFTYNSAARDTWLRTPMVFTSFGTTDHRALTNRDALAQHPATSVTADTTNFNKNLSSADDTVQKALDTIDDLSVTIGTGTANRLAKWVGTGTVRDLGDSIVYDNGTSIGIGSDLSSTYSTEYKLQVGSESGNNGIMVRAGSSSISKLSFDRGLAAQGKGGLWYDHTDNTMSFRVDEVQRLGISSSLLTSTLPIALSGSTSGSATIKVPAVAGTTTFQLPGNNGTASQLLSTDGSGITSWRNLTNSEVVTAIGYTPLSGTGTTNYLPKRLADGTYGDSALMSSAVGLAGIVKATGGWAVLLAKQANAVGEIGSIELYSTSENENSGSITTFLNPTATAFTQIYFNSVDNTVYNQIVGRASSSMAWRNFAAGIGVKLTPSLAAFYPTGSVDLGADNFYWNTARTTALRIGGTVNYFSLSRNGTTGTLEIQGSQAGYNDINVVPTSGKVGIGLGAVRPSEALHVAGNVKATSLILPGATSGTFTLKAPVVAGAVVMEGPSNAGTSGQVLTKGAGDSTTWATVTPAGIGAVSGTGTLNYIPKWTGSGVLGDSRIYDTGTNITSSAPIEILGSTSGSVTVKVPAVAGTTTFQLPGSNGSSGQFLQTNGSGVTSWQTITSGVGGAGNAGYIPVWTGSSTLGNSSIVHDSTNVTYSRHVIPAATTTYSLGDSTYRWHQLWANIGQFSGTVYCNSIGVATSVLSHLVPGTSLTYNLGSSTSRWFSLYAANISLSDSLTALNVTLTGGLTAATIYASTSINAGNISATPGANIIPRGDSNGTLNSWISILSGMTKGPVSTANLTPDTWVALASLSTNYTVSTYATINALASVYFSGAYKHVTIAVFLDSESTPRGYGTATWVGPSTAGYLAIPATASVPLPGGFHTIYIKGYQAGAPSAAVVEANGAQMSYIVLPN